MPAELGHGGPIGSDGIVAGPVTGPVDSFTFGQSADGAPSGKTCQADEAFVPIGRRRRKGDGWPARNPAVIATLIAQPFTVGRMAAFIQSKQPARTPEVEEQSAVVA